MHPLLGNRSALALYLVAWAAAGCGFAAFLAMPGMMPWSEAFGAAVPLFLLYCFICLSPWYLCRSLPVKGALPPRYLAMYLLAAVFSTALWLIAVFAWFEVLQVPGNTDPGAQVFFRTLPAWAGTGIVLYLFSIVGHYLLVTMQDAKAKEKRALELSMLAREAELRALRAQVDPHFLFNSLNSVSALTARDPMAARDMCLRLAEYFRGNLAAGARDLIPLSEELALLDAYFSIERVRFGERLSLQRDVETGALACAVPALLLQPLAENCVKHGVARMLDVGTITLRASVQNGRLGVQLCNPSDDAHGGAQGGLGLSIVRRRLKMQFGETAGFVAEQKDGRYCVTLDMPATEMP